MLNLHIADGTTRKRDFLILSNTYYKTRGIDFTVIIKRISHKPVKHADFSIVSISKKRQKNHFLTNVHDLKFKKKKIKFCNFEIRPDEMYPFMCVCVLCWGSQGGVLCSTGKNKHYCWISKNTLTYSKRHGQTYRRQSVYSLSVRRRRASRRPPPHAQVTPPVFHPSPLHTTSPLWRRAIGPANFVSPEFWQPTLLCVNFYFTFFKRSSGNIFFFAISK